MSTTRLCCPGPVKLFLVVLSSLLFIGCGQPSDPQSRLDRAIQYHAAGTYRSAMIELKNILQKDPSHRQARFELGKLYVSMGQGAAAEKELTRARELGAPADEIVIPFGNALTQQKAFDRLLQEIDINTVSGRQEKSKVQLLRGNAYLMLGKYEEATQAFHEARSLHDTARVEALVGLSSVALKTEDLAAADKWISQALAIDADAADAWMNKGQLERKRKNLIKAEEAFTRAIEIEEAANRLSHTQLVSRVGLIQVLLALGKTEDATLNVEWMLQTVPDHPAPKYFKALLAYGEGDFDTASGQLQEILRIDPGNKAALMLLGVVNLAKGSLEQADMYLSAFLNSTPDDITARKLLAATRIQLEKPEYALETLESAGKKDEEDGELLALMGAAHLKSGDSDAGIQYLERAMEARPDDQALQSELVTSYIRAGKVDKAIKLLESGSADGEGSDKRELLIILAYIKGKNNEEALKRAQVLLEKKPDDPVVNNLVGSIMAAMGDDEQALVLFNKAVDLNPEYDAAVMNIGRLALRRNDLEEAEASYKKVLKINPENVAAMVSLARLAEKRGSRDAAVQWMQKAREADKDAVGVRLALVRYYLAQRKFRHAREIAEEAFNAAPARPDVLNALGVTQMWSREYQKALYTFKQAEKQAPESVTVIFNLARVQLSLNDRKSASKNLRRVLKHEPGHKAAVAILVALDVQEGNTESALRLAKQQQDEHRNEPDGYVMEGDIHLVRRKYAEARRAYLVAWNLSHESKLAMKLYVALQGAHSSDPEAPLREWLEENPDDVSIRAVLAQAYQDQGKIREATEQYEHVLGLKPENPTVLNNLAWSYYENKDLRAVDMAEKAHKIAPDQGVITDTLGWLLVESGDHRRGIKILKKAVKQSPDIAMIRYHLAVALARSDSNQEAKKVLNEAIQLQEDISSLPGAQEILKADL